MVVALEDRGWLFVNQTFVASFDLSDVKIYNGDVAIAHRRLQHCRRAKGPENPRYTRTSGATTSAGVTAQQAEHRATMTSSLGTTQKAVCAPGILWRRPNYVNPYGGINGTTGSFIRNPVQRTIRTIDVVSVGSRWRSWEHHHTRSVGDS